MKKILLGVVAIAALASYNIYRSNNETENMSDTMLANVEALAYSIEIGNKTYYCDAPFDVVCSVELGETFKGHKRK